MPWNSRRWPIFRCRTIDSTVSNRCDCNKSMCLSPTYSTICWRTSFDGLEIGQDSRIILVCCNIRLYLVFHRLNIPLRLWTQAARVCVLKESREVFPVRMRWHLVRRWMKPHSTYRISCCIQSSLRIRRQASYSEHGISFRSRHCTVHILLREVDRFPVNQSEMHVALSRQKKSLLSTKFEYNVRELA